MHTVTQSGTFSDKMAAMILMIQESPYHRLALLDELLKIAGEKNVRNARVAIDALKELFLQSLLPPHVLSYFYQHEFSKDTQAVQLKKWYFEDAVKARFTTFIKILEVSLKKYYHNVHLSHDKEGFNTYYRWHHAEC
jgi:hypothetical protein